jgi:hypothetical protein
MLRVMFHSHVPLLLTSSWNNGLSSLIYTIRNILEYSMQKNFNIYKFYLTTIF